MVARKHISHKTARAALIVQCGLVPYVDAKKMTEDQIISLFHLDHNILHETGHEDRDKFWNLTHTFIKAHREKTKQDAKIIAKGRRIRERIQEQKWYAESTAAPSRKTPQIRSRGFDRRYKRKMDGTVVKR